ncbi:MAG: hypothetical protein ACK4M0_04925 [Phreatobacter sp.]
MGWPLADAIQIQGRKARRQKGLRRSHEGSIQDERPRVNTFTHRIRSRRRSDPAASVARLLAPGPEAGQGRKAAGAGALPRPDDQRRGEEGKGGKEREQAHPISSNRLS